MEITLLGTRSPLPDPLRAGPATLVRSAGCTLLVDCGRGVLMRLAAAGLLPPIASILRAAGLELTNVFRVPKPSALSVIEGAAG